MKKKRFGALYLIQRGENAIDLVLLLLNDYSLDTRTTWIDSFDWTRPACLFRTDLLSGLLAVIIDFSLALS